MTMIDEMARAAYERWIENVQDLEPKWDDLPQEHRDRLVASQRAALEAMKEMTPAMVLAARSAPRLLVLRDSMTALANDLIQAQFRAAIQAALDEEQR